MRPSYSGVFNGYFIAFSEFLTKSVQMEAINVSENSCFIETELKDILTINSCTTLISELIKLILYRKQQLPYTFDRLKYLVTKRNSKEKQEIMPSASVERQFKLAEDGLKNLELIFEKIKEELANSNKEHITEVALLFGSTPMSPKQVYSIHLPELCLNHSSVNHPERRQLIHLLQSVILSNDFCKMLKKPMNPTNMFFFIKKTKHKEIHKNENNKSEWLIPNTRFEIPKIGQHFHIKFQNPNPWVPNCRCQSFEIYSDKEESEKKSPQVQCKDYDLQMTNSIWYQACAKFKGFTDVYMNGVSVADLWIR